MEQQCICNTREGEHYEAYLSVRSSTSAAVCDCCRRSAPGAGFRRQQSGREVPVVHLPAVDIASTDTFNYLGAPSFIANPNIDRGNSDFDIRHAFTAGVTYNLPAPQSNKIAHVALGGWSVDSFIFARTAPPVNVTAGYSFADGAAFEFRPNVVPGVPLELFESQYPGGKAL